MTRNNLSGHLSWLLKNAALSKPAARELPQASDSASFRVSQSQSASGRTAELSQATTVSAGGDRRTHQAHESWSSNGPPKREEVSLDTEVVAVEDDNMGRLDLSTGSKKPSLLSQNGRLATPSSESQFKQRLNETLKTSGAQSERVVSDIPKSNGPIATPGSAKPKQFVLSPAKPGPSRRSPSPGLDADFADFDVDDLEYMDLTRTTGASDESEEFGEDVKVWTEKDASWEAPLPKSKKRKSADAGDVDAGADTQFPDVYQILGTSPPVPTPGRHSVKKVSSAVRDPQTTGMPIVTKSSQSAKAGSSKLPLAGSSSPLGRLANRRSPSPIKRTPDNDYALTSSERRKKAKVSGQRSASSDPLDNHVHQTEHRRSDEYCIPDSDDEFVTPPSVPAAARKDQVKPFANLEEDDFIMDVEDLPTAPESRQKGSPPAPRRAQARDLEASHQSPSETQSIATADNVNEILHPQQPFMPSSQSSKLLSRIVSDSQLLAKRCDSLDEQIRQNDRDFMQAINDRLPKDKRDEIKAEKERLVRQQKATRDLDLSVKHYRTLHQQREAVAQKVARSYAEGINTDEEEARLDELTEHVETKERELSQMLAAAGLTEANLLQTLETPATGRRDDHIVVLGTQAGHGGMVNMSRSSRDVPLPLGGTQVVHQTQLPEPVRSQLWNEPIPAQRLTGGSGLLSQENQNSRSKPFPRESSRTNRLPDYASTSAPRSVPTLDHDVDAEEDFFSDIEDMEMQLLPKPVKKATPAEARNAPQRSRTQRAANEFSDFSDDADMLAFAQDYEVRQSAREPPLDTRRAFSETSGNAVPAPKQKQVSKRQPPPDPSQTRIPAELMRHPWSADVQKTLKDRFRMKGFRQNQLEAINATLAGEDAFVLMPTGGGKSLCYQLPAVVKSGKTRGVTIVVSPLLSLMQDQVDHMKALGIQAVAFNSECSPEYKRQVMSAFDERNPEHFIELLYVTPEMASKSPQFMNAMQNLYRNKKFARIVIDEAHCVSQWGHDFRPDYKTLGQLRAKFPQVPVMALTATATQNVIVDIKHNLRMKNCQVFSQSFNRPNLYYEVRPKGSNPAVTQQIAALIKAKYPNVTGIIYTISRKQAEDVAQKLSEQGITARHYHALITPSEKVEVQTAWQKGQIKVVVATIAFGMGIDKPDVRYVIHHGIPKSLEGYYQETGRAGRDGKPSDCILFYGKGDIRVLKKLILDGDGNNEQKERQMVMLNRVTAFCDNKADCRRTEVLRYFGEDFSPSQCNKTCDNCQAGLVFEQQDFSEYAIAAIRIVQQQHRLTANQCADILIGRKYPDNEMQNSDEYHGMARGMKKHEMVRVIDRLSAEKGFHEDNVVGNHGVAIQYLQIGPAANQFLTGRRKLMLTVQVSDNGDADQTKPRRTKATKKQKEPANNVQSTYVSSPVNARRRRATVVDSDDESNLPTTSHGYVNDGFVVSDEEMEDEGEEDMADEDEAFEPLPQHRPAKPTNSSISSKQTSRPEPIQGRQKLEDLPDIHQDVVDAFVQEARQLEEQIRNRLDMRRPMFTDAQLQEMAMNWTTSLDSMKRIPGIDVEKVQKFGKKLIPILERHQGYYREISAAESGGAGASASNLDQEIVDLISSDLEIDEDEEEAMGMEEDSHYFAPKQPANVQAFHDRLQSLNSQPSQSRGRSYSRGGGGGGGGGGRRRFSGGKKWSKKGASGGGSQRRGSGSGGRGGGGSGAGGGSSSRSGGGSSGGFKRDGKIVKKSGGGIGLMPL
ncbi:ATP-dependent helicase SGS1 [Trichoderma ghanense]|uniref:DNA 3'-5' helicase n=1 Tax=Trichoderma ghanense TaxID=65468 RepID=A0ABY2H9U6_9HYPO